LSGNPYLLLVLLALSSLLAGVALGVALEKGRTLQRRANWRARNAWRQHQDRTASNLAAGPLRPEPPAKLSDAADQLRVVMGADFVPQPLLNKSEARVFRELDQYVLGANPNWQVMAQVSLGEILSCKDAAAYGCINSKRVDLLLVDGDCQPRHAIEYQGGGHYRGTAAARDAVKREALRRAGIGYHEVVAGHTTPSDLRRLVERLVDRPAVIPDVGLPDTPEAKG